MRSPKPTTPMQIAPTPTPPTTFLSSPSLTPFYPMPLAAPPTTARCCTSTNITTILTTTTPHITVPIPPAAVPLPA